MTPPPDLLAAIIAGTRRRLAVAREVTDTRELEQAAERVIPQGERFHANLARNLTINIIAECKRRSPSRGVLRRDYQPTRIARAYAEGGAAALSILTEPTFFDGALAHLSAARTVTALPLLRKDFIVDHWQLLEARAAGADAVLLIAAALSDQDLRGLFAAATGLGLSVLVEVHDLPELDRALAAGAEIVGVNNRNLRTFDVDVRGSERIAAAAPPGVVLVSESGLRTAADLQHLRELGFRAFLIGERLMTSLEPGAELRALLAAADQSRCGTAAKR